MKKLTKILVLMLTGILLCVNNAWGASVISMNGSEQDASTTISSSNATSGSAGKVSWNATNASYTSNKSRWDWASGSSVTFSVPTGYVITTIVSSTTSTKGTLSVDPTATITGNGQNTCTISGLSAQSVTITTSGQHYINSSVTVTYTTSGGGSGGSTPDSGDGLITIDASKIASFGSSYSERTWTDNGISGKCYAYRAGSSPDYLMQFNSTPYVYNTDPIPGRIKSIKITYGGGTARSWSVYCATTALTSTTGGTQIGTTQTISTNYTWTVPVGNDYQYFYIVKGASSTQISSIIIEYEATSGGSTKTAVYLEQVNPMAADGG